MSVRRPGQSTSERLIIARPRRPLGQADLNLVRQMLADASPRLSVELDGTCADDAVLVVMPEGGDDAVGPSFVISREPFGFRLEQLHWDEITEIGVYAGLANVAAAVRLLASFSSQASAASATRH